MYVICLSGTFDVFFKEFWRWEQPTIAESMEVSGERIEQAVRNAMAEHNEPLPFIGLDMPTSDWPRMVISYDGQRRHVAQDGALIEPAAATGYRDCWYFWCGADSINHFRFSGTPRHFT